VRSEGRAVRGVTEARRGRPWRNWEAGRQAGKAGRRAGRPAGRQDESWGACRLAGWAVAHPLAAGCAARTWLSWP
jgi:hypothetical protein